MYKQIAVTYTLAVAPNAEQRRHAQVTGFHWLYCKHITFAFIYSEMRLPAL